MLKNIKLTGILIILILSIFVVFISASGTTTRVAKDAYMVYLDGKKVGLLDDKEALYDMIDKEQETIKNEYNVDKVYPPQGLKAIEYTTYNNDLKTASDIYNMIEENSTFTVKGYVVTIKGDEGEPKYINILNKEDLEPALLEAISTFIKADNLNAYIQDNQVKITDTGKLIENIYFEEKITLKEAYLPVASEIITNKSDLAKYLLFGTLEPQTQYTVKEGDTVESVATSNRLSSENLLISNPELKSVNSLLSPGQKLNVGYIAPLFTIVEMSEVVEDVDIAYERTIEKNNAMYIGQSRVKQEGVKGKSRLTEKVTYKNGETKSINVIARTTISEPINEIVMQGTLPSYNFSSAPPAASSTEWGWPTISPYVIMTRFEWRWGSHHGAIDIAGCGIGSPIYSSTEGTVVATYTSCAPFGYYGSMCGGSYGNYVEVLTSTGLTIIYAHMLSNIRVSVGQTVTKGQLIGHMGSSGSSTGPHLHFEIREGGVRLNPCTVAFAC